MNGSGQQETGRSGSRWVKAVLLTVLIAISIVVLFTWVFPWVEEQTQDPTIGVQLFRLPR
jgi:flagellar basal body-associated protein FliL